ncbi:MAG: hypothetical protein DRQ49_02095 [Gammaproteobacteria bacterium]|nr:MAG: hypothetical protein DRQ49_02095 [Gammaproteobacteria bacterium]RKZ43976.1 MAG: hypothetical protein DRQ41_03915 [Gammaproteobacteria bacterium]RKZ75788.1 MAG: hypothetical protein DRQ57_06135 [Gammaproteobacteria bacterium]
MLRIPIIILGFISLISIVQAADNMVVIRSNATPDFSEGQLLDSTKPVNLPAEAEITVVFSSGAVLTVSGPYQGQLKAPLPDNKAEPVDVIADPLPDNKATPVDIVALSNFLTDKEHVRGTKQAPEDLWLVDVSPPKRFYCIAPSARVTLWRSENNGQNASTLLIKHKRTGEKAEIRWPAYQMTLKWPGSLTVHYGETYTVKLKNRDGSSFKKLVLYKLPNSLPTKSHKVVWMVGRGCIPQANMLLASLR